MKKVQMASIAPASVVAVGGVMIAGGNGPVKGIRMAGVVIEDAPLYNVRPVVLGGTEVEILQRLRS